MRELWKDIPEYDAYAVSNHGRIRRTKASRGTRVGKLLNPWKGTDGYLYVTLCIDREIKAVAMHRLVCLAFMGPYPEGKETNHKDGDKANPRLDNLEWMTRTENNLHCVHVLGKNGSGKNSTSSKTYIVTSPVGKKYKVKGLRKFCREQGLHKSHMFEIANRSSKQKTERGWTCRHHRIRLDEHQTA